MLSYPAKILKDGDFFLVSFRDFYHEEPVTQGGTYEEALAMAADWLLSVATIAKEKQEELPQPGRTHQKLSNEPRYRSPFIGDLTRGTF